MRTRISSFSGGGWYETGRFLIPMRSFHFSIQWSRWKSVIGNVRDPGRKEKNVRDASRWSGLFVIRFEKPMLRVGNFKHSMPCCILKKNRRCAHKDQSFGFTWFKAVSMKVLKIPLSSR